MIPRVRNFVAKTLSPLVCAGALLLAGCGNAPAITQSTSGPSSQPTAAPAASDTLTVPGVGFGGAPSDPSYHFSGNPSARALITNPSKVDAAAAITAQFTFYGSDGKVVGTGTDVIEVLRTGQTVSVHATPSGSPTTEQIARVDVQPAPRLWEKDPHTTSVILGQGVTVTPTDFDPLRFDVNGQLVSHYKSNVTNVAAEFYCTDASGKFLAASGTFVQLLPGGGTAGASQMVFAASQPAKCQLYAALSAISQASS